MFEERISDLISLFLRISYFAFVGNFFHYTVGPLRLEMGDLCGEVKMQYDNGFRRLRYVYS